MEQLLPGQQPVTGSEGATSRIQQLNKQIPNYDMDVSAAKGMSSDEKKQYVILTTTSTGAEIWVSAPPPPRKRFLSFPQLLGRL